MLNSIGPIEVLGFDVPVTIFLGFLIAVGIFANAPKKARRR